MPYSRVIQVEFNHCDPAGIVFYPRFLEFANSVTENFFADVVGRSYARIIADRSGVPTVSLECDFRHPSRLGDRLTMKLRVTGIGRSSLDLAITGRGKGEAEPRFSIAKRVAFIDAAAMRSTPWPEEMRANLAAAMKEDTP
ncbi:acyl-CoA thioesterase [Paracoccus suum]|uniref:Acyl-CoA thioesterase n=1 Tax=Paracoccus suum TaxID=2259340 RepID=A0A344PIV8_9RHOB|nr:thioesterase family protein [Paracoccus suum]AXC49313.1 acyl-CoA thioesterase [Paracoccus suum]